MVELQNTIYKMQKLELSDRKKGTLPFNLRSSQFTKEKAKLLRSRLAGRLKFNVI